MTNSESKRLKPDDLVRFTDGVRGRVIETGYAAVKVVWDDGQIGIIHHDDMRDVTRVGQRL